MSNNNFSLDLFETSANALSFSLNRNNIFPPLLNDPLSIISQKRPLRKRTPNAFFVCRMNVHKELVRNGFKTNMRLVSKVASILWKNASNEEKHQYILIANFVKELHSRSMQTPTDNSYNPYYSFPLSLDSPSIKTEQQNSEPTYFQALHYYNEHLILSNSEVVLNVNESYPFNLNYCNN
jgi:hypothetical protein